MKMLHEKAGSSRARVPHMKHAFLHFAALHDDEMQTCFGYSVTHCWLHCKCKSLTVLL